MTTSPKSVDKALVGTRAQAAFDAIVVYIRTNELRLGDPLPTEAEFGEQLGVSRTVVREALGALSAIGLVDVGVGRRARVGSIKQSIMELWLEHAVRTEHASVQQIWDVRRALEQRTAFLAAIRRSDTEAEQILRLARAIRQAHADNDLGLMASVDIEFHLMIAAAARNGVFGILLGAFRLVMEQTIPVGWRSRRVEADQLEVFDMHDRIARAIAAQEPEEASQAMADHFALSVRALVEGGLY